MSRIEINWLDSGREPQCPPNPDYPTGIDIDLADEHTSCWEALPYPARRCGVFYVVCRACGTNAIITTAGRADDPRSVRLRCRLPSA